MVFVKKFDIVRNFICRISKQERDRQAGPQVLILHPERDDVAAGIRSKQSRSYTSFHLFNYAIESQE